MFELTPTIITLLSFGAVAAAVFVLGQYIAMQGQIQRRLPMPILDDAVAREDGRMRLMEGFVAKHFGDVRFGVDATLRGKLRRELLRAGFFRRDALNYYLFFRT